MQIPWLFPDFSQYSIFSLTFNKIPWLLPSLEFPWLFPDRWKPCQFSVEDQYNVTCCIWLNSLFNSIECSYSQQPSKNLVHSAQQECFASFLFCCTDLFRRCATKTKTPCVEDWFWWKLVTCNESFSHRHATNRESEGQTDIFLTFKEVSVECGETQNTSAILLVMWSSWR